MYWIFALHPDAPFATEVTMIHTYILVTPARNEERFFLDVARSVHDQTVRPELWVIVDDGSSDGTTSIIRDLAERDNWILGLYLPPHPRDPNRHLSYVIRLGFEHAIKVSNERGLPFDFIGVLDADTVIGKSYFERLMEKFEEDPELGIASGGIYIQSLNGQEFERSDLSAPRGTGRLWSKKCFLETVDNEPWDGPNDTISTAKARMRGYKTRQYKDVVAVERRVTSSFDGIWNGYYLRGETWHYLNAHPLLILMNVAYFSTYKPYYAGFAFLCGYASSVVKGRQKTSDKMIQEYFWHKRVRQVVSEMFKG
jgi:glycosyltransferase involved in cell wall biosynthesis